MDSSGPKGQTEARSAEGPSEQRAAAQPDPQAQRAEGAAPKKYIKKLFHLCD